MPTAVRVHGPQISTAEIPAGTIVDADINAAAAIASSKLADYASVANLVAQGLGASHAYVKTDAGIKTLLAGAAGARIALIVVHVDETFAAIGGNAPIFDIGETDTGEKYKANMNTGTAGDVLVLAGTLTTLKAIEVFCTARTGTSTGGITVEALVLPAAA